MIAIQIVFGKEEANKILNNISLNNDEMENNVKTFTFNSEDAKKGFIKGINAALGWQEGFIITDKKDFFK